MIRRTIGDTDIMVDPGQPAGLWLPRALAAEADANLQGEVGRKRLLRLLARKGQFLPLTCQWEMLDRCNFHCQFCYIVGHSHARVARWAEIEDHITQLVDAGLLFCTLTGGECLLHPDFIDIFTYLKARGVLIDLFTNGLALDDRHWSLFAMLPPRRIEVSIYSLDNETLAARFRARGDAPADRVLANVLRLRDMGMSVECKTFINSTTADQVPSIQEWCDAHALEYYTSSELTGAYDGADLTHFAVPTTVQLTRRATRTQQSEPLAIGLPCDTRQFGGAIDAAFRIAACPSMRVEEAWFDLRTLGVAEALQHMERFLRTYQDAAIHENPQSTRRVNCLAYAEPRRDSSKQLVGFRQPAS